ncbi:MAG: sialate O-acetylesterase [Bacilli bacterium]|nr:sialate O-acetylesterase [Bacilli bacterium]
MKVSFKLLMLTPFIFSSVGCGGSKKEPTPVDVIVISGQSNAVGCTHADCITRSMGHSKYQEYMSGYPEIQIAFDSWTKDEKGLFYSQNVSKDETFMKTMLGQGNGLGTFGPEIGIAETMHEKYGNKLFLIKYACGASNLKDDWAQLDSPMYPRLIKYVKRQMKNLEDMGYTPIIKAFCWMQGEGDAWEGYYQKYFDNLSLFVSNLRADLRELAGNVDLPFIDAGISNSPQWQFYGQVNEAKKQFAALSENNIYIDTIAAGMHTNEEPFSTPDTAHYDSESEVLLGQLFAQSFEPFLTPVEDNK